MNRRHYPAFVLLLLLAGCDSMPALPSFGEPRARELSRKPDNSTEYLCEGKRVFYVRAIDGGAVWLYAPDREIRLEKIADGRWGVGKVLLETNGAEATLTDPPAQFSGCKKSP